MYYHHYIIVIITVSVFGYYMTLQVESSTDVIYTVSQKKNVTLIIFVTSLSDFIRFC